MPSQLRTPGHVVEGIHTVHRVTEKRATGEDHGMANHEALGEISFPSVYASAGFSPQKQTGGYDEDGEARSFADQNALADIKPV